MKKYSIVLLSAVLAFAGCNKENTVPDISAKYPVFSSVAEELGTKTEFGESYSVVWTEDDRVAVFNGTTQLLQYKAKTGGSSQTELEAVAASGSEGSTLSAKVAFYPYSAAVSCSESDGTFTISTSLAQTQSYKSESFGVGAAPMMAIATAENPSLFKFKNVFSCLKLQFTGTGSVKSVTVKGNNGEYMAGDLTVSMKEGATPVYEFKSTAVQSVTLDCGDGVALSDTPTQFYLAVPCQEYAMGITVSVVMADGTVIPDIATNGKFEIKRSAVRPMAACKLVGIETELKSGEESLKIVFCNSCYAYSIINSAYTSNASGVERKPGEENEYSTNYSLNGSTREYTHDGTFYSAMGTYSPKLLLRGTSSGWTSLHGVGATLCQPTDGTESGFDDYDYTYKDFHAFGGRRRQVAIVVDLLESCNVESIGLVNWNRTGSDGLPKGHLKGVEFYVSDDPEFIFTPAFGAYRSNYDYSNYANPNENNWTLIAKEDNLPVSTDKDDVEWVNVPYSVLTSGNAKGRFLKIRFVTNTGIDGATGYSARELYVKKATNLD